MDNEMIERVAKAIRLRDTTDEFAMARAAIKAMRKPTKNVIDVHPMSITYSAEMLWTMYIDSIIGE